MRRKEVSHGLRQKVPYETIALVMLLIILAIYLMLFIFRSGDVEFLPSPAPGPRPHPTRPMGPKSRHRGKAGQKTNESRSRRGLPPRSPNATSATVHSASMGPARPGSPQ